MEPISGGLRRSLVIGGLSAAVLFTTFTFTAQAQSAVALGNMDTRAQGLPSDIRLILANQLPYYPVTTWCVLRHAQDWPPSPVNWAENRNGVSYYVSDSMPGNVWVDDPLIDLALQSSSSMATMATSDGPPPPPSGGGGGGGTNGPAPMKLTPPKGVGPGQLWLEIIPDSNYVGYADLGRVNK